MENDYAHLQLWHHLTAKDMYKQCGKTKTVITIRTITTCICSAVEPTTFKLQFVWISFAEDKK